MAHESVVAEQAEAFRTAAGWRPHYVPHHLLGLSLCLCEIALIVASGVLAPHLYAALTGIDGGPEEAALGVGLLGGVLHAFAAQYAGLYRLPVLIDPLPSLPRHLALCGVVILSLTGVFFCLKTGAAFSRGALGIFAVLLMSTCTAGRLGAACIVSWMTAKGAIGGRPVFLLGEMPEIANLDARYLLVHYGVREAGRLLLHAGWDDCDGDRNHRLLAGAPRLAREAGASGFLVAGNWQDSGTLTAIERSLRASPLPVRLLPGQALRTVIDRAALTEDRSRHLVVLQRAPMGLRARAAKRALDLFVASATLIALSPVFAIAALAIKFDTAGPVLFRQRRGGFDQRQFTILKFRTMTVVEDGASVAQARRGDGRVTRVGALLRRSSIDELPQLFNVLRGDMALVGPRPHALAHDHHYRALIGTYGLRHRVRPGITGWAQVNGLRGETARPDMMARRIELDLWYIGNWSLLLDLRILGRTVLEVMRLDAV